MADFFCGYPVHPVWPLALRVGALSFVWLLDAAFPPCGIAVHGVPRLVSEIFCSCPVLRGTEAIEWLIFFRQW